MRKIIASLFISLDGMVDNPQWTMPYFDETMENELSAQMAQQDTYLLGRVSYQEWEGYWPTSTDEPFATFINNTPKYVISNSLEKVEWKNSTLLKGDFVENITRLKQQPGKNIGVGGSITLVQALLRHGLLDELRLAVHPVAVGKGRRLFEESDEQITLNLIETKTSKTGVVILAYQPVSA